MKVVMINVVCGIRSTGRICTDLATALEEQGHEVVIAYGRENVPAQFQKYAVRIGTNLDVKLHGMKARFLDRAGFGSKAATIKFIKWLDVYKPDMIWLHNLHGYYINIELLFEWIKNHPKIKIKWTLHDCWAFTGHCCYFSMIGCEKWRRKCNNCPGKKSYPASLFIDNSQKNFSQKKKIFTGVKDLTIIVPSYWLKSLVQQSFLREYKVDVVYNTINTEVFKPTESAFREEYDLTDKYIILGVASVWEERKGLNDFVELSKLLPESFKIVLIGLSRSQIKCLPNKILGIERTENSYELAGIYSTADVFVNPSKEETFGMTTLEAFACGTPAIVYKGTACEEIVQNSRGFAVEPGVNNILTKINEICTSTL